jgi:hypothetical protein
MPQSTRKYYITTGLNTISEFLRWYFDPIFRNYQQGSLAIIGAA